MTFLVIAIVLGVLIGLGNAAKKKKAAEGVAAAGAKKPSKLATFVVFVVVCLVLGVVVNKLLPDPPKTTATVAAQAPTETAVTVTAAKLYRDYDQNEIAADTVYKGKLLLVTATVQSIEKDFTESPYLMLAVPNDFMGIHANLKDSEANTAATLAKGNRVSLLCRGAGRVVGSPILNDCVLR